MQVCIKDGAIRVIEAVVVLNVQEHPGSTCIFRVKGLGQSALMTVQTGANAASPNLHHSCNVMAYQRCTQMSELYTTLTEDAQRIHAARLRTRHAPQNLNAKLASTGRHLHHAWKIYLLPWPLLRGGSSAAPCLPHLVKAKAHHWWVRCRLSPR